jgi:hypothetical protein
MVGIDEVLNAARARFSLIGSTQIRHVRNINTVYV